MDVGSVRRTGRHRAAQLSPRTWLIGRDMSGADYTPSHDTRRRRAAAAAVYVIRLCLVSTYTNYDDKLLYPPA